MSASLTLLVGLCITNLSGSSTQCLSLWRRDGRADPYMHAIHFMFSLGYAAAPALATQFLSTADDDIG